MINDLETAGVNYVNSLDQIRSYFVKALGKGKLGRTNFDLIQDNQIKKNRDNQIKGRVTILYSETQQNMIQIRF